MKKTSLLIGLLYIIVLSTTAQNKKAFYKFPTEESIVYDICFTNNGRAIGIADNKSVKVYSIETNELLRDFVGGHTEQILSIDISTDSTLLVSGGKDNRVVIWDFREGEQLEVLKCDGIVTSVSISPDGKSVVYGASDNKVFVYDIATRSVVNTFADHSDDITSIVFSPDGRYIVTSSGDKLINIYENGALITTLSGHKDWVRDVSFDSEGAKLISCSDDGRVIVWNTSDINNPSIIKKSENEYVWVLSVDFNKEDNKTYALSDHIGNAKIVHQMGHYSTRLNFPINKILFKPKDVYLKIAIATRGGGVLLIAAKDMKNNTKKTKAMNRKR